MKKELLAALTSLVMMVSLAPTVSFAVELEGEKPESVEEIACVVEEVTGTCDVIDDIEKNDDEFIVETENMSVIIPEEGDESITIEREDGNQISMELPEEFASAEGEIVDDDIIVYDNDGNVSAAIQGVQEEKDDIVYEGIRSLITIENADAPHDYSFDFDIPEGCILKDVDGYIYIVNENAGDESEVIGMIEPAWAKDANGESVNTYYSVRNNTLVQTVEFDEDSAFPIVADPNIISVIKLAVKASHYNAHRSYTVYSTRNGKRYKVTYKAIPRSQCYLCKYNSY